MATLMSAEGAQTVGVWPGALKPGDLVARFGWLHEVASVETRWFYFPDASRTVEGAVVTFTSGEEYRGYEWSTVQRVEDRPL